MNDLTDKDFVVLFNAKSKNDNDPIIALISSWPEVAGFSYSEENESEENRYDRGTVTLKNEDNAVDVMHRLENLDDVKTVIPPFKYLLS